MKQDHEAWVERTLRGRRNVVDDLPPMVQDTVYSNLLPVRQMPQYIYGAPCPAAREADVVPKATADTVMTPFVIRAGWLWAFQDLRDEEGPFAHEVTVVEAEQHLTAEWYAEPDRLGWYIALLNRSFRADDDRPGNFEALVLEGSDLVHYWRDNSDPNLPWHRGVVVSAQSTGPACLIEGSFRADDDRPGNFEALLNETTTVGQTVLDSVVHHWRDNSDPNLTWHLGVTLPG